MLGIQADDMKFLLSRVRSEPGKMFPGAGNQFPGPGKMFPGPGETFPDPLPHPRVTHHRKPVSPPEGFTRQSLVLQRRLL